MSINEHHIHGNYIYAITFTTHDRKNIFSDNTNALVMTNCIITGRVLKNFWLLGFVVMPDHVHLIIKARKKTIADCVGFLKGSSSNMLNKITGESRQVWQRNYFSRPVEKIELLLKEIEYIEGNPVEAGICIVPSEYLFSSANIRDTLDFNMIDNSVFWEESHATHLSEHHPHI